MTGESMQKLGVDIRLIQARRAQLHRTLMGFDGDLRRAAHRGEFLPAFINAHVMQHVVEGVYFLGGMESLAGLATKLVQPADQALIEQRSPAQVVIDPFPVVQQVGKPFFHLGEIKSLVHTVLGNGRIQAHHGAIPHLPLRVTTAAKQHALAFLSFWNHHEHCIVLPETGQVQKITVLAIGVIGIVVPNAGRRRQQNDDGVLAGHPHQLSPAPAVFFLLDHRVLGPASMRVNQCIGSSAPGPRKSSRNIKVTTRTYSTISVNATSSSSLS